MNCSFKMGRFSSMTNCDVALNKMLILNFYILNFKSVPILFNLVDLIQLNVSICNYLKDGTKGCYKNTTQMLYLRLLGFGNNFLKTRQAPGLWVSSKWSPWVLIMGVCHRVYCLEFVQPVAMPGQSCAYEASSRLPETVPSPPSPRRCGWS